MGTISICTARGVTAARVVACLAMLAAIGTGVCADTVTPPGDLILSFGRWNPETQQDEVWMDLPITANSQGVYQASGQFENAFSEQRWVLYGNSDPVASHMFTITNTTQSIQTYVTQTVVPLSSPLAPGTLTSGVIRTTVVDNNGDGATLGAVTWDSVYRSLIDGVTVQQMMVAPFTSVASAYGTKTGTQSFGLPGQTVPGPAAYTSIGLIYRFTLTPGDNATISGNYVVIIPEPATGALVVVMGIALAAWRCLR